jgi:hypothetical protein
MQAHSEAKVVKKRAVLVDDCFEHPNTSLLVFQFAPELFLSSEERLKSSVVKHGRIEERDLYTMDHFFSEAEEEEIRTYSKNTSFSRKSYGSSSAAKVGEKPALSMSSQERWQFFARPPKAISEVYRLLSTLSARLNVEITTLPWELWNKRGGCSPSVVANKLEESSIESRELGKHQDCNPQEKISFGIPMLYAEEERFYPSSFINGLPGNPWLVSLMVYVTEENFTPEYGLGTVFYDDEGHLVVRTNCVSMRLVFFQGDIWHSIEESAISGGESSWRISYVFKLLFNPKDKDQNIKETLLDYLQKKTSVQRFFLGSEVRI